MEKKIREEKGKMQCMGGIGGEMTRMCECEDY